MRPNGRPPSDRHGHAIGDQILRLVADTICQEVRGAHLAVRYRGDEFLVILPGATSVVPRTLATRIERRLTGWVEVSTGAAVYHHSLQSADELIEEADRNLYPEKARRKSSPGGILSGGTVESLLLPGSPPAVEK